MEKLKVDREILFPPSPFRLSFSSHYYPSPPLARSYYYTRCQNNLIICRADDRSCILLVKNVSPSPISPPFYSHCEPKLAEHFDISNEIFPPRNVDNFVRLETGCRVKFLFGIRRNILVKYLFRDTRVCRFYISFFCSFFLSFFFLLDRRCFLGIRIILIDVGFF